MLDLFDRGDDAGGSKKWDDVEKDANLRKGPRKKGLEGMLSGLDELWDKELYEKEYDVDDFVRSLKS